jgi:hypothetical protein
VTKFIRPFVFYEPEKEGGTIMQIEVWGGDRRRSGREVKRGSSQRTLPKNRESQDLAT